MPSLFTELRRRNVFKVGAAYVIVAWLLLQVTDIVLPTFNAPQWVAQTITFLLIIGLPIALLLAWAYEMTPEGIKADADVPRDSITPATGRRLNYVILGLVVLAVGFLVTDQYVLDQGMRASVVGTSRSVVITPAGDEGSSAPQSTVSLSSAPVRRAYHHLGVTTPMGNTGLSAHVALSPDGRRLAYGAEIDGITQLYVRELDQLEARALPDTNGAFHPFFSPDGEWVVFFTDDTDSELKRVAFRGGPAQKLADIQGSGGGFWGPDDRVVFGTNVDGVRTLFRVPATGGTPEPLITPEPDVGHQWPSALPGGTAVLFVLRPGPGGSEAIRDGRIAVMSLDSREFRVLIEGAHRPQYVPTGHIVFVRSGALWAVPFDAQRLEITGPEVPVIDGVQQNGQIGGAAYAFSDDGMLIYAPGGDLGGGEATYTSLVWVNRQGAEESLAAALNVYRHPRLSPDGQRLAVGILEGGNQDVWIIDLASGAPSRLTFNPAVDESPLWTPDGERVVFRSDRDDGGMFWKAADGTGQVERLTTSPIAGFGQYPETFSPDGTQLVFRQDGPEFSLHVLSMDGERASRPLTLNSFAEHASAISPDGEWIAYDSHENGSSAVYVRPFPNVGDGQWQVSRGIGSEPLWNPQGGELFYDGPGGVMVVQIETEPRFSAGSPRDFPALGGYIFGSGNARPNYDITSDGQRFVIMKSVDQIMELLPGQTILIAVENWFEELKRLAPPSP